MDHYDEIDHEEIETQRATHNQEIEIEAHEPTPEQVEKAHALETVIQEAAAIIGRKIRVEYEATIVEFAMSDGRINNYVVQTDDGAQLIVKDEHVHFPI